MKKSTVNKIPVRGSNFKLPNATTTIKCKIARDISRNIMIMNGARNSLWSFRKPTSTKNDEITPKTAHPRNIMLNHKFTSVSKRKSI
jgi:hypothetical protein